MERKIGEIFEYNGEWYQCIVGNGCENCAFNGRKCYIFTENNDPIGDCCADRRKDNKDVIFKRLKKVGEPFSCDYYGNGKLVMMQEYQLYEANAIYHYSNPPMYINDYNRKRIAIEIKQNKENNMEEKKLNLKPFDLQAAKEGKLVCTRAGRRARIICFDRKFYHDGYNYPIVAMVNDNDNELVHPYTQDGLLVGNMEGELDLMMLPEKKEGWVNVAKEPLGDDEVVLGYIFNSYEDAVRSGKANERYVATVRIEWEE